MLSLGKMDDCEPKKGLPVNFRSVYSLAWTGKPTDVAAVPIGGDLSSEGRNKMLSSPLEGGSVSGIFPKPLIPGRENLKGNFILLRVAKGRADMKNDKLTFFSSEYILVCRKHNISGSMVFTSMSSDFTLSLWERRSELLMHLTLYRLVKKSSE